MNSLVCGRYVLDLASPKLMAIVNLTADSFSGDGVRDDRGAALRRAEQAVKEGADMLDLGAESTRPGAVPVSEQDELDLLLPVVEELVSWNIPLSVDTLKPAVMSAVLRAGADMINDVNGFRAPGAVDAVREGRAGLCVMHMLGEPRTMQQSPEYDDVVTEVGSFLDQRVAELEATGVARERIVLDPGFGFGKTLAHNCALLREIARFRGGGLPVLAGMSRKSMLGAITGREVDQRMVASVAAALIAVERGAGIVRVHDVAATSDALKVWRAVS